MRILWVSLALMVVTFAHAADIYVSPQGDNTSPGTLEKPVATLAKAQELARVGEAVQGAPRRREGGAGVHGRHHRGAVTGFEAPRR